MSFLLPCPNCGERPVAEFRFGGEHHARPSNDVSEAAWTEYLYDRRNTDGPQTEWWFHRFGCRCWFLVRRDTRTNAVAASWWPEEPVPAAPGSRLQAPSSEHLEPGAWSLEPPSREEAP